MAGSKATDSQTPVPRPGPDTEAEPGERQTVTPGGAAVDSPATETAANRQQVRKKTTKKYGPG